MPYFLAWHPEHHTVGQLFPRTADGYATHEQVLRHGEARGHAVNWTVIEATNHKQALQLAGTLRWRPLGRRGSTA